MSKRVLLLLAEGFEEIEAVAPIDILTRAGVRVMVAGLAPGPVKAAYGTTIVPETTVDQVEPLYDGIVFPGGRRNAAALAAHPTVVELTRRHVREKKLVAAICAAPSHVLGEAAGILRGKRATGDPTFDDRLAAAGAIVTHEVVTVEGNVITGMGPGAALLFGLALAEYLAGKGVADEFAAKWRVQR